MKKKLIVVVAGLLIVAIGCIGTFAALSYFDPLSMTNKECNKKDNVEICLSADKSNVTSRDTVEYTVTLRNLTAEPYTKTFNSTCTDPAIVNKADPHSGFGGACGMAITDHTLGPLERQTFTIRSSGSNYKSGENTVYAAWAGHKSPSKRIIKQVSDQADIDRQFKECQSLPDNINDNAVPGFCEFITVILADTPASCQTFRSVLAPLNLAIPCVSGMDIGVGFVYVPADDTTDWVTKIRSLSGVESAN